MARLAARWWRLADGRRVEIGSPEFPADAAGLVELERDQVATDPHRIRDADEDVRDAARFEELARERGEHPLGLMLVARDTAGAGGASGGVVGRLVFTPERHRKLQHHGVFGIVVHSRWRGVGVGTGLIATMLDWAREHERLEKVELAVLEPNRGARRLYRRIGFRTEARLRRHVRMPDGRVVDDYRMAIYVKEGVAPAGFETWRGLATVRP